MVVVDLVCVLVSAFSMFFPTPSCFLFCLGHERRKGKATLTDLLLHLPLLLPPPRWVGAGKEAKAQKTKRSRARPPLRDHLSPRWLWRRLVLVGFFCCYWFYSCLCSCTCVCVCYRTSCWFPPPPPVVVAAAHHLVMMPLVGGWACHLPQRVSSVTVCCTSWIALCVCVCQCLIAGAE